MNKIQKIAITMCYISFIIAINSLTYYWGGRGFCKFILLNSLIVCISCFGIYGIEEANKLDDNDRLI